MFCLQPDDRFPDLSRESRAAGWRLHREQTCHAVLDKQLGMASHSPGCTISLASAFRGWLPKEHNRADQFVGALFARGKEQFELVPTLRRVDPLSLPLGFHPIVALLW